eukprot:CAMPEP_0204251012 /NCGR_PEP_ID=MMETSP0361-20130328/100456_1 /ASSEMBLY_ACC=CAM_ASM_000343 /TAXON_ID=268821 /ORGANISM="Scrippsiella Hangoei, Strain SHTV-5" /LENGTH=422 /DNA_ID=CAMNT_0051224287 /DNA_START=57 /DNA_END=1323 /DNA_ORIENTATION=+
MKCQGHTTESASYDQRPGGFSPTLPHEPPRPLVASIASKQKQSFARKSTAQSFDLAALGGARSAAPVRAPTPSLSFVCSGSKGAGASSGPMNDLWELPPIDVQVVVSPKCMEKAAAGEGTQGPLAPADDQPPRLLVPAAHRCASRGLAEVHGEGGGGGGDARAVGARGRSATAAPRARAAGRPPHGGPWAVARTYVPTSKLVEAEFADGVDGTEDVGDVDGKKVGLRWFLVFSAADRYPKPKAEHNLQQAFRSGSVQEEKQKNFQGSDEEEDTSREEEKLAETCEVEIFDRLGAEVNDVNVVARPCGWSVMCTVPGLEHAGEGWLDSSNHIVIDGSARVLQEAVAIVVLIEPHFYEHACELLAHLQRTRQSLPPIVAVLVDACAPPQNVLAVLDVQKRLVASGADEVIWKMGGEVEAKVAIS